MIFKKTWRMSLFLMAIFSLLLFFNASESKDLKASLAQLPGLSETPDKGTYVDLVKAIDEVYTEGIIKIEVYPMPRSINNAVEGKADFHIPLMNVPGMMPPNTTVCKEKLGNVSFVIYSHKDNPITKKMIDDAIAKGGEFPYKIEAPNFGFGSPPFILMGSVDPPSFLKKVDSKRTDAFIMAQEDIDITLKQLKMKNIHREFYKDYNDILLISGKGAEADRIDGILSKAIKTLRASGRLDQLYSKLHVPYNDWQPSKMGW